MATAPDFRDGPRDECGVFGIYAPEHDVSRLAYFALFALQHRGQESAGIATASRGGNIMAIRDQGLVTQVFDENKLRALVGDMAIGHVRYSTTGASEWENTQPIVRDDSRTLALAHNGNLINAVELHAELRGLDVPFRSTSDSEIIAALLSSSPEKRIEDAVAATMPRLEGAYSGRHRSRRQGGAGEFADFREYAEGEDLRRLDWKVLPGPAALTHGSFRTRRISPPRWCSMPARR